MASSVERRRILIEYLHMKADECDWHGVRDACVDLEMLEAKHPECVQTEFRINTDLSEKSIRAREMVDRVKMAPSMLGRGKPCAHCGESTLYSPNNDYYRCRNSKCDYFEVDTSKVPQAVQTPREILEEIQARR